MAVMHLTQDPKVVAVLMPVAVAVTAKSTSFAAGLSQERTPCGDALVLFVPDAGDSAPELVRLLDQCEVVE
jgi:hypothetical protein